jgi:hypothetical protein
MGQSAKSKGQTGPYGNQKGTIKRGQSPFRKGDCPLSPLFFP